MSLNVTVCCFMREETGEKCGKVNIDQCIKGKLFNIWIVLYLYIYIYIQLIQN